MPQRDFSLISEVLGYNTNSQVDNTDPRFLVAGSQNVLIDRNRKVKSRQGYSRLGVSNTALTPVRNAWTWNTSTGTELMMRFYDDELEVYLGTIDTLEIDAWTRVLASWNTTEIMRVASWWDATENLDLLLAVIGDDNIYEWNGAVAVVSSITGTTITKKGTSTFAQNRFYTTRNKTLICVRTGTEYTYTGGESTTTLTGIADTTGLQADDILIQKMVTNTDKPAANRTNDTIFVFENQLVLGSNDDNEVYISKNNAYATFTYSSPRIAGEGGLLTLDAPSNGFGSLDKNLIAFSGRNSIYKAKYLEITVSTTLTETLTVEKVDAGVNQGCQSPDSIIQIGNSLVYLTYEPALRMIDNPDAIGGLNPRTLSNPIKPDFDNETWTNIHAIWYKNTLYLCSPQNSKLYMLEFVEDADGKLRRFWQAPQILPIRAFSFLAGVLYIHSNSVPETYKLFDGYSDTASDDSKLPINAIATFAYNTYGKRALEKNFDEYYVEGEISPSTVDLLMTLGYNYGGYKQIIYKIINGTNETILEDVVDVNALGQTALGQQPFGGLFNAPANARKFRVIFEIPREDFNEIQPIFSTNEVDRYFSIIAHGANVAMSLRKNIFIKQ